MLGNSALTKRDEDIDEDDIKFVPLRFKQVLDLYYLSAFGIALSLAALLIEILIDSIKLTSTLYYLINYIYVTIN